MSAISLPVKTTSAKARSRGLWFWIKRALKWIGIGLLLLLIGGAAFQEIATYTDRQLYPAPGQLYTVNGHLMHLHCMGEDSPTVILEAGAFSFSLEWYWVQRQLAPTNRVCAYDRAGLGWSEPAHGTRDGVQLVTELHALLTEANVEGPYVLAGHSLGAVLNRIYATQYPDEVMGIVMIDTGVPIAFDDYSDYEAWYADNGSSRSLVYGLTRFSLMRLIVSGEFREFGYPEEIIAPFTALKATIQSVATWDAEVAQGQWVLGQQSAAAEDFGALPMMILWADHSDIPEFQPIFQEIQQEVSGYSSNSITRTITGSTHGSIIGSEHYAQQVTNAIVEVIESVLTGAPLAQ